MYANIKMIEMKNYLLIFADRYIPSFIIDVIKFNWLCYVRGMIDINIFIEY